MMSFVSLKWLGLIMAVGGLGLFALYWRRLRAGGALIAPPFAWMGALYLLPILILVYMSFGSKNLQNQPPFDPPFQPGQNQLWTGSLDSYKSVARDLWQGTPKCFGGVCLDKTQFKYGPALLNSVVMAMFAATLALIIAFPFAYAIARAPAHMQGLLLMGVILPFWSFYIIRIYAFRQLLRKEGPINQLIDAYNAIPWLFDVPALDIYPSSISIVLGIVYTYLPFAILPLYAVLQTADPAMEEAAADLGASPLQRFWRISVPLAAPGLVAAFLLVGVPAMGEYVIPQMMGPNNLELQNGIIGWEIRKAVTKGRDWPMVHCSVFCSCCSWLYLWSFISAMPIGWQNEKSRHEYPLPDTERYDGQRPLV